MSSQRGFTMIELLVTLTISVFGLLGLLAVHTTLSRGVATTDQTQEAVAFGTSTLETLRSMRIDQMTAAISPGATAPPFSHADYAASAGRTGTSFHADVAVTEVPGAAGLWRVRVEVNWTEAGEDHMLPLEVLRTSREAL